VNDQLHILKKIIGKLDDIEEAVFNDRKSDVKTYLASKKREITSLRRIGVRKKIENGMKKRRYTSPSCNIS
jgi:Mg2+ and Co2+ transporter CorA